MTISKIAAITTTNDIELYNFNIDNKLLMFDEAFCSFNGGELVCTCCDGYTAGDNEMCELFVWRRLIKGNFWNNLEFYANLLLC